MNIWIAVAIFIGLGTGLAFDVLFIVFWWDKLPSLFKRKLDTVPWEIRDVFNICLGLFLIYFALNVEAHLILKLNPDISKQLKPILSVVNGVLMYGLGIWLIVYLLNIKYVAAVRSLGVKWAVWVSESLKSVLMYLGFIPLLIILTYLGVLFCTAIGIQPEGHPLVDILKKEKSAIFIIYLIITAVIIAPVFEELLFRGLFYQALKKKFGIFNAMVISSSLFSLLHFNTAQFLPIVSLGMLLCFIFEYTGSLVPAIFVHVMNNGLFLALFFLLKDYIS